MDEEFQARMNICGENWWSIDSARSVFPALSTSSSPCSVAAAAAANDSSTRRQIDDDIIGNLKETSTRSCADSTGCYLGCFDAQTLHKSTESASGSGSSILMDSTLQMMGFALTSSSTSANWNHPLFRCNGRPAENNFHNSVLQQELTGIDSPNPQQIQRDYWNPKSFSNQVSTLKPMNQDLINLLDDQQSSLTFPIGATSYGTTFPSTLSNLYDPDIPQPQPQQYTLFTNRSLSSHSSSKANYGTSSSNELSPIWSKVSTFVKPPPIAKQHPIGGLHFSNNTPFWNASAEALHDMRAGSFASSQSQYQTPSFEEKPNFPNTLSNKLKSEETMDSASMAEKNVCDPALKRQRIETPSTLPTFKVRKEKLGDRVTALQQLVSPFGKTDTASVLYEAIEYIKFLHDQVSVLSTPYMKNGSTIQQQQGCDDMKDRKPKQDLRSRGLCLVPISSTFPVATETTTTSADHLWTPTFGGALLRRKKENGKPQPTREEMVMIEEKS